MIYFASIFAYLLVLAGIGIYKARQVKSQEDFAVAGRSLSPWIMVCTMLAVWIGTGSIVGNAEKTYETGVAALILPSGTFVGMILLSLIASRARKIEASSVPEIIGRRFGQAARALAVVSLVIAYMVIVSYQFNAGGAVLEVITGTKDPVTLRPGDVVTAEQISRGRLAFTPESGWTGRTSLVLQPLGGEGDAVRFSVRVVPAGSIVTARREHGGEPNTAVIKKDMLAKVLVSELGAAAYRIDVPPENGALELREPFLTARTATVIAAVFIIAYTMLAGLMSLAYTDIVTGIIITVSLCIAFPVYWFKAGGWEGMSAAFAAMGDRSQHMQFWGVFTPVQLINYCLPVFLLVLGDANQYQRIFASRNARGARSAVTTMIFAALAIELLIIACAWIASSMTPDPENGKYILIYAAKHYLPLPLSCLFMVTVVGIIISTADGFLLIPATTFMKDVYLNYINPGASERRIVVLSRIAVLTFGIIAYLVSRAFAESTGFFEKALYAFTIYGASITPSLVAAIVWRGATRAGSIASIFTGTIVALAWGSLHDFLPQGVRDLDAVLPAILLSVLCLVAVSMLTGPRKEEGTRGV